MKGKIYGSSISLKVIVSVFGMIALFIAVSWGVFNHTVESALQAKELNKKYEVSNQRYVDFSILMMDISSVLNMVSQSHDGWIHYALDENSVSMRSDRWIKIDATVDKIEDEIYALSNPELMGAINTQTISKLIHILEKSDI